MQTLILGKSTISLLNKNSFNRLNTKVFTFHCFTIKEPYLPECLVNPFKQNISKRLCIKFSESKRKNLCIHAKKEDNKNSTVARRKKRTLPLNPLSTSIIFRPLPFFNIPKFLAGLSTLQRYILFTAGLISLASIAWFFNINASGLIDDTEPLFVESSRQMLVTGDWITPQFNALPRFDKPILVYWFMAISVWLFGVHEWSFRFPSAFFALLLMTAISVTVSKFGIKLPLNDVKTVQNDDKRISNDVKTTQNDVKTIQNDGYSQLSDLHHLNSTKNDVNVDNLSDNTVDDDTMDDVNKWENLHAGIISAVAFTLNIQVVAWGSTALSDMIFTSFLSFSILSFFWSYSHSSNHGYFASSIFLALSFLTKGLAGLIIPILVISSFLLYNGEFVSIIKHEIPFLPCTLLTAFISLPWFILMFLRHGISYLNTFFGYHHFERFAVGVNHHDGRPWWYSILIILVMYFPFSYFIPSSIMRSRFWVPAQHATWRNLTRSRKLPLLAVIWFLVTFAFFALSKSQLPSYYLPLSPAIAILASSELSLSSGQNSKEINSQGQSQPTSCVSILSFSYQLIAGLFLLLPSILIDSGDAKAAVIGKLFFINKLHFRAMAIFGIFGILLTRTQEFSKIVQKRSKLETQKVRKNYKNEHSSTFNKNSKEKKDENGIKFNETFLQTGIKNYRMNKNLMLSNDNITNNDSNDTININNNTINSNSNGIDGDGDGDDEDETNERQNVKKFHVPSWIVHASAMAIFFTSFFTPSYRIVDRVLHHSVRTLSMSATHIQKREEPFVMIGSRMPSVVYYSKMPVAFFDRVEDALQLLNKQSLPNLNSVLALIETPLVQNFSSFEILAKEENYLLVRIFLMKNEK